MKRLATIAALTIVAASYAPPAQAFNAGKTFGASANTGGGGGILFTGATRWRRYDCSICHVDAAGAISIKLESDPADLLTTNEWVPGQRYRIKLQLVGEHLGMGNVSNINNFMADITDASKNPAGQFAFDASQISAWAEGSAIGGVAANNRTEWSFDFTAPAAGAGRLELNIAAVDGNGAGSVESRATDLLGDDVATLSIPLCERGGSCIEETTPATRAGSAAAGCNAGHYSDGSWLALILGFLGVLVARQPQPRCAKK